MRLAQFAQPAPVADPARTNLFRPYEEIGGAKVDKSTPIHRDSSDIPDEAIKPFPATAA